MLNAARLTLAGLMAGSLAFAMAPLVQAQTAAVGTEMTPTVWIDPDGCEHWVMDDGAEGYMSPHRNRDGSPVCHRSEICGIVPSDQLFPTDKYSINATGRETLANFFRSTGAYGYLIYGHTDSRASDEYNMRLSDNRANAVASIAQSVGAHVVDVKGFGERRPRAGNDTAAGMQQNRRVEIYCLR